MNKMPTNKERSEVAARLRNYENLRESFRESPICAFLDALGVEYLDWKGVCNRLSDLIEQEPERTCKNITDGYVPFHCSGCDCVTLYDEVRETGIMAEMGMLDAPNYCPNCGAKVV